MLRRSKVCILSPAPPPCGGIGNWTVLIKEQGDKELADRVRYFDTNIKRTSRLKGGFLSLIAESFFSLLWQFIRIFREIARGDVAVIHSCSSGGLSFVRDVYAACVCRIFKKKFVVHMHFGRLPEVLVSNGRESWLCRLLIKLSDVLVVIDRRSYESLCSIVKGKEIVLIPNSTNIALNGVSSPRRNIFVFAGWVVKTKGVEELLVAWGQMARADWRLALVGPYEAEYMDYLKGKYSFQNVDVLGEINHSDLVGMFRAAKIMCLPSYTEGFPFVVIEAMAAGCAVVATPVGAIPEILDGDAGVLVPVADADRLRDALEMLMEDQEMVEALSARAVSTVRERYQLSEVYKQYRKVWGV